MAIARCVSAPGEPPANERDGHAAEHDQKSGDERGFEPEALWEQAKQVRIGAEQEIALWEEQLMKGQECLVEIEGEESARGDRGDADRAARPEHNDSGAARRAAESQQRGEEEDEAGK